MNAVQYIEEFKDKKNANAALEFLAFQVDYLGGRILFPSAGKPDFRVQAFFKADGVAANDMLPDGCRLVYVPMNLRSMLLDNH